MKSWTPIALLVVLFLAFQLNSCLSNPDLVSEDHFVRMKPLIDDIAKQAKMIPLKTGQRTSTRIKKGKGISGRSSVRVEMIRDHQNRLFIIFDMGGGFLGNQGYIYAEEPVPSIYDVDGMPLEESYAIYKIRDQWWIYDSKED